MLGWVDNRIGDNGSSRWILYGNKIGVAGTVPVGTDVGLGWRE